MIQNVMLTPQRMDKNKLKLLNPKQGLMRKIKTYFQTQKCQTGRMPTIILHHSRDL